MEPLTLRTGWAVLHLFVKTTGGTMGEVITRAIREAEETGHQVVTASILGHKADACFMVIGPDLWTLRAFQTVLHAAGLEIVDSYLSYTEISEYAPEDMTDGMKRPRLYPKLPPEGKSAFCFYPMSKRRGAYANWYTLSFEHRRQLLYQHGESGRNFSDRVLQLVTGSTGVDNYEWGVTLFGVHPDDLKQCIYTMRYDEASAVYAEFGTFYTGMVGELKDIMQNVHP